jgi:hypothetical protein
MLSNGVGSEQVPSKDGRQVSSETPHQAKTGTTWHDLPEPREPNNTTKPRLRPSCKTPSPCW